MALTYTVFNDNYIKCHIIIIYSISRVKDIFLKYSCFCETSLVGPEILLPISYKFHHLIDIFFGFVYLTTLLIKKSLQICVLLVALSFAKLPFLRNLFDYLDCTLHLNYRSKIDHCFWKQI